MNEALLQAVAVWEGKKVTDELKRLQEQLQDITGGAAADEWEAPGAERLARNMARENQS